MSQWSAVFYFSIISAALALSLLGLWFTAALPGIDRWSRRFFRVYFIVLMACCFSGLADVSQYFVDFPRAVERIVMGLECLILSLPLPMLTVYLLHSSQESIRASRLLHTVLGLMAVYIMLLVSAMFIDGFSYVMLDDRYIRGPLYPLLLLPLVAILLINFAGTVRRRSRLPQKVFLGFLIATTPLTVAMIIQLFVDVFVLFDISYVLSALVMYGFVLSNQIEQDLCRQREIARQQQEIADQRASIMVLQMRPHFIYNTLTSVYCLCDQDPPLARQVIRNFTTYLRNNLTAVASAAPIPFPSELEHTRAYLAVEQALYEESLLVEYDTPHTVFRVPPLTLQPIVENAVKHGRDPFAGALHISIRTRKTAAGSEITVADDGRGFTVAENGEPHLALENIRQRLENMCGGSLTIAPRDGGGTVVTVSVPDSAAD